MITQFLAALVFQITRRGAGLFKILFVIDDFIRIFTMTILLIILSSWLNFPTWIMFILAMIGLVIDIQDFVADHEIAKFFD